jgi:hypothetical protein
MYAMKNKSSEQQTAAPEKYPQRYFKPKPCRHCGTEFTPKAPSHLYCGDRCSQRALTSAYLKRTYGITIETYEHMLEDQNHRCKICGGEGFLMDRDRHKIKLVVDHCHVTGAVRGLLCHNCNRALGLLKDSKETLLSAIAYLEGATTIPKGSTP